MGKIYFRTAVALLAAATLVEAPAGAQNMPTPKGKISASLLKLAKPAAATRGLATKASAGTNSPLQATNAVQVYNGYVVVQALATTPSAKQLLIRSAGQGLAPRHSPRRACLGPVLGRQVIDAGERAVTTAHPARI